MDTKTIEIYSSINIVCATDFKTGKDRLLVCVDDPNQRKQYLFIDELLVGDTKFIALDTRK